MADSFPRLSRREWLRRTGLGAAAAVGLPALASGQTAPRTGTPAPEAVLRYPDLKYINLAGNENPFGPSPAVSVTVGRNIAMSCRYPFREEVILADLIAEAEGLRAENVLLGNGCDDILSMAGAEFGRPGARIVATEPTYLQLMEYAERRGAHVDWVPHTASMHHDLDALASAITPETTLVYLCNPDTPSGTMLPASEIEAFCREVAPRVTIFLDEVYLDLLEDFREQTQTALVEEGLPVIIGRSFSKMHALAGHRVGYALASPDLIERLGRHKMSSLNFLGVAAARVSLEDRNFHAYSRRKIAEGRTRFCALLEELRLPYTPSHGNFVFHHTGIPIREFQAMMKERDFLVGRPFPPYDDWCRISIGNDEEMRLYERAMREVFADRISQK